MSQHSATGSAGGPPRPPRGGDDAVPVQRLEQEGDIAADYLEGLLDIADLDGDLDMDVQGERAVVTVLGDGLGVLVGSDGKVLDALQDLTRLAVLQATGERSRLLLEIGGHRARRREQLARVANEAVDRARSTGQPQPLAAMTPFERKIIHDAVAAAGLTSVSEGTGGERRVVVHPG